MRFVSGLKITASAVAVLAAALSATACSPGPEAGRNGSESAQNESASVTFAVAYRERVALDDGAIAEAQLLAFAPGSDTPTLIAEVREAFGGRQVPVDLTLAYDRSSVPADHELAVSGRIIDPGGSRVWLTPEDARFPAGNPAADLGVIMLVRSHHAGAEETAWLCDDGRSFTARYAPPDMEITLEETAYNLSAVPAASGARYEATTREGPRVFWSRGAGALVRFDAEGEWVRCDTSAYMPETSATPEPEAEPESDIYTARGNEPGWILRLSGDDADYLGNYGETRIAGRVTGREALSDNANQLTVESESGERFTARIEHAICQDSMAGLSYPDTVSVTLADGETYSGCGGDAESLLTGDVWRVTHIAGEEVPGPRAVTLEFDGEGRLSGQAPCNRYSASYQMTGEGIVLGQGVSTRMACAGDLMGLESTFLSIIQGSLPASIDEDGTLSLGEGRILAIRD